MRLSAAFPNIQLVLAGTEEDGLYCAEIARGGGLVDLSGKTTLGELVQLLSGARLLITIDNGNSHLACALGTPLLALFGSSNPVTTGPWGRPEDLIYHKVYCSPCCDKDCREKHHQCMEEITVDEVFAGAAKRLWPRQAEV